MLNQLRVSCWQRHLPVTLSCQSHWKSNWNGLNSQWKTVPWFELFSRTFFLFCLGHLSSSGTASLSGEVFWCDAPGHVQSSLCSLCVGNGMGSISCTTSLCLSSLPQLYKWMMAQERALARVVFLANNCFTWLFATPVSLRSAEMWFISGEKILPQLFWF